MILYSDVDVPVLRVVWKGGEDRHGAAASTRWTLHTTGNSLEIFMQIGETAFTRLHHFVDDLRNEYNAELLHIFSGLTFVFRHGEVASENKMVADKVNVMHRFQNLVHGLGPKPSKMSFHVSFDGHGEIRSDGNGDSALTASDNQLQLRELEKRLEEHMLCMTRNMENFINNVILQNRTHIENELDKISSVINAQRDAAPSRPTYQSDTNEMKNETNEVQTDQDNDHMCGGESTQEQCNELEGDAGGHTRGTSVNLPSVSAEFPSNDDNEDTTTGVRLEQSADVTLTCCNKPTDGASEMFRNSDTSTTANRRQSLEHCPSPSEIISKNYYEAQEVLTSLNINLDGWKQLTESTALALEATKPPPPRSKSATTILCLDVSESVGGDGFEELKEIAHSFIDGIESMAERYGLEENLGVVAVGGDATVVQDITNDYGSVRDTIDNLVPGGPSPLFAGLVVSVTSIKGRTGTLSIGGAHNIKPRIIFMTDGYATSDSQREGQDAFTHDSTLKVQLLRLTTVLARDKADTHPITWVPVGKADKAFLSSLAKLGNQELVEGKDICSLCNRYRLQDTTAKLFICLSSNPTTDTEDLSHHLDTLAEALIGDMNNEEKSIVIQAVKDKLEGKDGVHPDDGPSDFDNVLERDGLPPLGSRVRRGPDWKSKDEDSEGPGTIINHSNNPYLVWVRWDFNSDRNYQYSYGYEGQYDVLLVDSPRRLTSEELIEIGIKVQRGIDWSYGRQDGGPGSFGIVIRRREDGKVKVRWDNGHINVYNFGCHGRFDIEISSVEDAVSPEATESHGDNPTQSKDGADAHVAMPSEDKPHIVWQWKDESGNWRLYTQKQIEKLNKEFNRKPARSCVLQKGGQSVRILFKEPMLQKSSNDSNRHEVQRVAVSSGDRDQLIQETASIEDVGWTWV
ncbi:uncharacterized protein [Haliotis cracherodii]|uniref:uncharacterized protein isoform X2 n=1 Tax=Haliotis cracherodii TaxID=6455 RepID=UPI0039EBB0A8